MNWTKTIFLAALAGFSTFAVAMAIKESASASVKDAYFQSDTDALHRVPSGIITLRKTHFPRSLGKIRHYHEDENLARTVGRNVSLRDLIAEAYDCDAAHVILPPGAPKDRYDFLVTSRDSIRANLRSAISKQLALAGHFEQRNVDIFALKIADSNLPGLTLDNASQDSAVNFSDGKLHFKHEPVSVILKGLQDGLNAPILDETGLTNRYDFSVTWNHKIQKYYNEGAFSLDGVNQFLNRIGLGLEPETVSENACVVAITR